MKPIPEDLYKKIEKISETVRKDLRNKGLVVPVRNKDKSITIGRYTIIKEFDSFYTVLDFLDEPVITRINLAQTAILVTNKLALGYYKDTDLLDADRKYGYADFEESLYKNMIPTSKSLEIHLSKYSIAKKKKELYKASIVNSFQKLVNLV
jgi:hypothetical protein